MQGRWNDGRLRQWAESGGLTPYDPKMINGASIDLRLSNMVCLLAESYGKQRMRYGDKSAMAKLWRTPEEFARLELYPGQAVLFSTMEFTKIPVNASADLLSKSTAGRSLIEHFHAGYGDPGFEGTWTLEIINFSPFVWIFEPGDRVVQLVMTDLSGDAIDGYGKTGRYQGQVLPTAPKGW